MRRSTLCCAILVALLGNGTSDALRLRSGQAQANKPGPEHKKLEYTWTFEIADEKGVYSIVEEGKATKAK